MIELICGLGMIGFLYWLGGVWLPDHKPIQQELIKTDFLYGVEYKLEEEE
jgi:hypothetical protein